MRRTTTEHATLAQLIEQLICNLQVLGLSPRGGFEAVFGLSTLAGRVSKRPKDGDCKSSCVSIRWFESTRAHSRKSPALIAGLFCVCVMFVGEMPYWTGGSVRESST